MGDQGVEESEGVDESEGGEVVVLLCGFRGGCERGEKGVGEGEKDGDVCWEGLPEGDEELF